MAASPDIDVCFRLGRLGDEYRIAHRAATEALIELQDTIVTGAKRGLTVKDMAAWSGLSRQAVARAIRSGAARARSEH